MKNYFYLVLFFLVTSLSCSNREQEIEELIRNKNYTEAKLLLKSLSDAEKEKPKIKELQTIITFNNLLDTLKNAFQNNSYILIDSLIDANIVNFQNYPNLNDSLLFIKKHYAFEGAAFFSSQKRIIQAYQCIIKYVSDNSLDISKKRL